MKKPFVLSILLCFSLIAFGQADEVENPILNFEALWKKFDQQYANFELKEVDWNEVYE